MTNKREFIENDDNAAQHVARIAYIKPTGLAEARALGITVPDGIQLPADLKLYVLHAVDGSVLGYTDAYASAYGAAVQNNLDSNFNTQEVMATLSSDTGGKAFFDSNDFSPAFQKIQQDTSAYYVVGFRSTDPTKDGRFRRLSIKVNRPDLKLEYRTGYYAPADYRHANHDERERQLQEQLASDLPATDVEVYLQAYYFRSDTGTGAPRFSVPVSLIVPGSLCRST